MGIRKLENAVFESSDWRDEIVSKDGLKKGFLKIEWEISGDDLIVKTGSIIDIDGNLYLIDSDETITGPITDNLITFDGSTFSYSSSSLLFNEEKKGYYLSGTDTRVIGNYYNGEIKSVIFDTGSQKDLQVDTISGVKGKTTINSNLYLSSKVGNSRIVPTFIPEESDIQDITGDNTPGLLKYVFKIEGTKVYRSDNFGNTWTDISSDSTIWEGITYNDNMSTRSSPITMLWNSTVYGYISFNRTSWSGSGVSYTYNINYAKAGPDILLFVQNEGYVQVIDSGLNGKNIGTTEDLWSCCDNKVSGESGQTWVVGGDNGVLYYMTDPDFSTSTYNFVECSIDVATTDSFKSIMYDEVRERFIASTDNAVYQSLDDGVSFTKLFDFGIDTMIGLTIGIVLVAEGQLSLLGSDDILYKIDDDYKDSDGKLSMISLNRFAYIFDGYIQYYSY